MQKVENDLHEAYKHINDVIFRCDLEQSEREEINKIRIGIARTIVILTDEKIKLENERAE
ncbi:hypothetical protein [Listeria monocytogenes]|nr:hypothetical protein [Listeria monocytogenes]EAH1841811.1 hypothetical protein [Listeria monocytogenes]ECW2836836.1 hypothetical protein [Listeria monocytogenes]EGT2128135.1 hypothetical protein [Listeria monocytogenes]EIC0890906.1 hypothetical protein [Listeria monocytogenes]EIE4395225.1 hypothetical protein [Listeria monocytogenes]